MFAILDGHFARDELAALVGAGDEGKLSQQTNDNIYLTKT